MKNQHVAILLREHMIPKCLYSTANFKVTPDNSTSLSGDFLLDVFMGYEKCRWILMVFGPVTVFLFVVGVLFRFILDTQAYSVNFIGVASLFSWVEFVGLFFFFLNKRSVNKYPIGEKLDQLARYLSTQTFILLKMEDEAIYKVCDERLVEMAKALIEVQEKNSLSLDADRLRDDFKKAHALFFEFKLVKEEWNGYFERAKNSAQETIVHS